MKNYCLVIICVNKPFNCVIRLITIMIHNIRRNNSTIFNTDKLISLFDCIEGNDIPQKMYMSFGFKYVDKVEITYVDIGVPRKFLLYEFVL